VERVRHPAGAGEHPLPENKIRERPQRLWVLVTDVIARADTATVYDNSIFKGPCIVAQMSVGHIVGSPAWPGWTPEPLSLALADVVVDREPGLVTCHAPQGQMVYRRIRQQPRISITSSAPRARSGCPISGAPEKRVIQASTVMIKVAEKYCSTTYFTNCSRSADAPATGAGFSPRRLRAPTTTTRIGTRR
jgi:hypothetical protein